MIDKLYTGFQAFELMAGDESIVMATKSGDFAPHRFRQVEFQCFASTGKWFSGAHITVGKLMAKDWHIIPNPERTKQ